MPIDYHLSPVGSVFSTPVAGSHQQSLLGSGGGGGGSPFFSQGAVPPGSRVVKVERKTREVQRTVEEEYDVSAQTRTFGRQCSRICDAFGADTADSAPAGSDLRGARRHARGARRHADHTRKAGSMGTRTRDSRTHCVGDGGFTGADLHNDNQHR